MKVSTIIATVVGLASASVSKRQGTGRLTFQNSDSPGVGACGSALSGDAVAVSECLWTAANPNADPLCGRKINMVSNGVTVQGTILDKQPGSCAPGNAEVLPNAFVKFGYSLDQGVAEVSWGFA
ncbi:hypothetical protein CLAFUW4_08356 [Fulvia fulva]|uniref:Papain inhibitor n=1 Tax=Passalora fulva TaxID=5499 RepID=UPI0028527D15|nr:Papain inhibitor [Fulvia fulva]KAK4629017.1 hypothetical protein CLAFUR4_08361 [Fulvia fulva]KAK4630352.1 hypothetical protein CLAFUR0_08356 [Fulvia fulva]WMI38836.1 Papain inhibitor [Fulvia fulva]WPV12691.1 hypothetical protein CLAFUW4_08356 [Fulvia fulva]WPV27993.1 hypothetical protein CLAFUW7_08356 [Fulvia fulva]